MKINPNSHFTVHVGHINMSCTVFSTSMHIRIRQVCNAMHIYIYNHKGSLDDPTYKIPMNWTPKPWIQDPIPHHSRETIRIINCSDSFMTDWQTGFRPRRVCRDNSMVLRTMCQVSKNVGSSQNSLNHIHWLHCGVWSLTQYHKFLGQSINQLHP